MTIIQMKQHPRPWVFKKPSLIKRFWNEATKPKIMLATAASVLMNIGFGWKISIGCIGFLLYAALMLERP